MITYTFTTQGTGTINGVPFRLKGRHPMTQRRVRQFAPFLPDFLFAANEEGAWYDPSDLTTLYQDSAGNIPVTADGQPVGLMLDKSKGLVLGAELISNGAFDSDLSGWVVGGGDAPWVWDSGVASRPVSGTTAEPLFQGQSLDPAKKYRIEFDLIVNSGDVLLRGGATSTGITFTASGAKSVLFSPASGTNGDLVFAPSVSFTGSVDNVSVKEIPGNHATQATSSAKRLYRTDGVLHWLEDDLFDDALNAQLPDLGTNATLAYADASGVTILTGQTISGSTPMPTTAQTYGVIYLDRPLTAKETTQVTEYLNRKRGA